MPTAPKTEPQDLYRQSRHPTVLCWRAKGGIGSDASPAAASPALQPKPSTAEASLPMFWVGICVQRRAPAARSPCKSRDASASLVAAMPWVHDLRYPSYFGLLSVLTILVGRERAYRQEPQARFRLVERVGLVKSKSARLRVHGAVRTLRRSGVARCSARRAGVVSERSLAREAVSPKEVAS